jgi:hypothetical protein
MAGEIIKILPKRLFNFSGLAVGSTQVVTVAERVDISRYIDCMVALRSHGTDLSGGTITFDVYGDGYTLTDPSLTFRTSAPLFASITVPGFPASTPQLRTFGGTARGEFAALQVTATRTAPNPLLATISIDLILREPDAA